MKENLFFALILIIFTSCKHKDAVQSSTKAHPADRKFMGPAVALPLSTGIDREQIKSSHSYRRKVAWDILQSLLTEVPIGEKFADINPGKNQLPIWQTWYESSEFQWMFDHLYDGLGKEGRIKFDGQKARLHEGLPDGYDFCPEDIKKVFIQNSNVDISRQFSAERFERRLRKFQAIDEIRGVSGNGITLFSPGLIAHYFQHYREIFSCQDRIAELDRSQVIAGSRSPCMSRAFAMSDQDPLASWKPRLLPSCTLEKPANPKDTLGQAVAVKTAWQIVSPDTSLAEFDSSAEGMRRSLREGQWQPTSLTSTSELTNTQIYTIETIPRIETGVRERFQLAGIHFTSKHLDDWLWISLWWSPSPNTDFGADRPKTGAFRSDSPWSHYKMCVVSSYDELDADPTLNIADAGLRAAIQAYAQQTKSQTWCSNPFIERGHGNSRTNCIGCHQHAGTKIFPDDVFLDIENDPKNEQRRALYPNSGRSRTRENFPGDYLWSFDNAPDFFQSKMVRIIRTFKDEDAEN